MNHITERDGRFYVTIDTGGGEIAEKSFATLNRAKAWASRCEAARMRYSQPVGAEPVTIHNTTLGELLDRYGREVSSQKRGAKAEAYKVARLRETALAGLLVRDVTPKAIATFRNERLALVANSTVRQELSIIRRSIEVARREWGLDLPNNPAALVTMPKPGPARERRLEPGEYEKLEAQLRSHPVAWGFVRFAIGSAMRRGEILSLTWRNVHLGKRLAYLPETKNGRPRMVPLTDLAMAVLDELPEAGERVFPIDPNALRWAWDEACRRAGIEGLRLHDLRHEGVSRLFEMGLSPAEVALISGHRTVACLYRYVNLRPVELARKLKGLQSSTGDLGGEPG